jgi:hypothetical protein
MMNYIKERFLNKPEGQIVFWGSIIYTLLFVSSITVLTEDAWYSFMFWMGGFMPIILLLEYLRVGGFKRSYESENFNAVMIGVIAIIPIIVTASSYIE